MVNAKFDELNPYNDLAPLRLGSKPEIKNTSQIEMNFLTINLLNNTKKS